MIAVMGGISMISPFLNACSTDDLPVAAETPLETTTQGVPIISTDAPLKPTQVELMDTPSPAQTEGAKSDSARIAFVKTQDRADGVHRAIDLLGINPVGRKYVFLKPNFNSADPAPGSTHPAVLRALILKLQGMGATAISLGDRSGMGNTREVMRSIGVFDLAEELRFETVVFDELGAEDWVMIQPQDSHWEIGFPFARPCLETEALVQTCCLKTHQYGGHFTMSLRTRLEWSAK